MHNVEEWSSVLYSSASAMSSLTQCNFCTLSDIGARAAEQGKFVKMVESKFKLGGHDAHAVDFGEEPSKDNWRGWFWKITTRCVCDDC